MLKPLALAHSAGRSVRRSCARLLTFCNIGPSGWFVARIDKLMAAPGAPLRSLVAPALEPGSRNDLETARQHDDLSGMERRVLIVATAAVAAGRHERAIEVLEQHLESGIEKIHPRIYERLAAAYLAMDRGAEAISVARRGLASDSSDPALKLILINALASEADWTAALSVWEELPGDSQDSATIWTRISIVRAFRKTGDPVKAERLAQNAAALWPENDALQDEIQRCRPFVVDWRRSWSANSNESDSASSAGGVIESMGFLTGGSLPLVGWLNTSAMEEAEVALTANGTEIARTVAAPDSSVQSGGRFSINCADLLQYLGDGDVVEVVNGAERLAMPEFGRSAALTCGHASRMDELLDKLRRGYVFTKDGRLKPGLTLAGKRSLLDYFGAVSGIITTRCGRPVYPFYGNLLGAVRQNDFISHDIGGFDMLYLCGAREPATIRSEVVELCEALVGAGFHLTAKPHSILIRSDSHRGQLLDLSYGWFNSADELNASYGWRFQPARGEDRFVEPRQCRLVDRDVMVPGNAEDVLVQLYGPSWRVPDQGFSIDDRLERVEACLLSDEQIRTIEQFTSDED